MANQTDGPQDNQHQSDTPNGDDSQTLQTALNLIRQKDQPPTARLDAIRFIIDQFETKFFPILEGVLNDDSEHPDVRSAAALALGKIGGDEALSTLISHAHSSDVTVKNYTIQALGILGREEGIPLLLEALGDTNNTIFASAAEALGEIGKPAVPHLIALLENTGVKDDVRCIAAWQLGQLKYSEPIPTLVKAIKAYPNPEIQALCIWALGEIGVHTADVIDVLHWAKQQENQAISDRAKMAFHKIARHLN
jgi:HEAT repeat protein